MPKGNKVRSVTQESFLSGGGYDLKGSGFRLWSLAGLFRYSVPGETVPCPQQSGGWTNCFNGCIALRRILFLRLWANLDTQAILEVTARSEPTIHTARTPNSEFLHPTSQGPYL